MTKRKVHGLTPSSGPPGNTNIDNQYAMKAVSLYSFPQSGPRTRITSSFYSSKERPSQEEKHNFFLLDRIDTIAATKEALKLCSLCDNVAAAMFA